MKLDLDFGSKSPFVDESVDVRWRVMFASKRGAVTPAKAVAEYSATLMMIKGRCGVMDPRLRGDDGFLCCDSNSAVAAENRV